MKLLLILISVLSVTNSLPRIEEDSSGPYWSQNSFEGVLQEPSNSSHSFHRRFSRANADNIKAPLERLQMIARITNGIFLQQGLSAGSIPSDALISELLFFGSVTPSEISQMEEQKIETAIETLKNLPTSFEPDQEISNAEKAFTGLGEVLDAVDGIGNLTEWKDEKEHFKQEIDKLATTGLNKTYLNELDSARVFWVNNHPKLMNGGPTVSTQIFDDVRRGLQGLKDAITNVKNMGLEWKFNGSKTALDGVSILTKAGQGVDVYIDKSAGGGLFMDEPLEASYSDFLDRASGQISSINEVTPTIQRIRDLVAFKHRKDRQRVLKYTHGLPDGSSDTSNMLRDVRDPWIKKIVKTEALITAFKQFETMDSLLGRLDHSMQFDAKGVSNIDELLKHSSSVANLFVDLDKVKIGLSQSHKCERGLADPVDPKNFTDVTASLKRIDDKLAELVRKKKDLTKTLKTDGLAQMCDDLIQICVGAQTVTNIQDSITAFQNYEKLKVLDGIIQELRGTVSKIDVITDDVKAAAVSVKNNIAALDTYQDGLKKYANYFACLQNQKELRSVFRMASQIQEIRNLKSKSTYSTSLEDGLAVVKKVTGIRGDLVKLKKSIDEFKGTKINGLEEFQKVDEHSKVIGESVQGVTNMRNALEQRTTREKVLSGLQLVKSNKKLLTDPEDAKTLKDLDGLELAIQSMYTTLDSFNGTVKDSDSLTLKNHSAFFIHAKSVTGIKLAAGQFLAISSIIDKLKAQSANPVQLDELKSSLDKMEAMGLDFARYHTSFDASKSSLAAMDTFFAKYNKRMASATPSTQGGNASGQNGNSSQQGSANFQKKDEEKQQSYLVHIFSGAGLLLLLLLLILVVSLYYLFVWAPQRERKRMGLFLDSIMQDLGRKTVRPEHREPFEENEKEFLCLWDLRADMRRTESDPQTIYCPNDECGYEDLIVKNSAVILTGYGDLFKTDFYHAVFIPITKKRSVILASPPTVGSNKTIRTEGKYYWLAKQYRSETIVLLSNPIDDKGIRYYQDHVPIKQGDTLKLESVEVKCLSMETVNDKEKYPKLEGVIEIRQLKITFKGHKPFTVRHIWYRGESDGLSCPSNTFDLVYILNMVQNDKTPPIYSSIWMRLAGCMMFIQFGGVLSRKKTGLTLRKLFEKVSEHCKCLQVPSSILAACLGLYELITQNKKVKVKKETEQTYNEFKKNWKMLMEATLKYNDKYVELNE